MTAETVTAQTPSLWQADPAPASTRVLVNALAIGLLAAATLRLQELGSATLLVGATVLTVGLRSRTVRPTGMQLVWAGAALGLLSVSAVRGATWLAVLCLLGAVVVGSWALIEARTWTGLAFGAVAAALVSLRATRWVLPRVRAMRLAAAPTRRGVTVAIVCGGLAVVFGGLFAAADAAYATLLNELLPDVELPGIVRRLIVGGVAASAAVLAMCLAQVPPAVDVLAPGPGRPVRRWEWVLPLLVLDTLFASFVVVQLAVLFGGRDHVLKTQGLSYADYARSGFWQLLVATVLTLAVVAVAVRTAPRATASDRAVLRALVGVLCSLALVVVISALQRMALYQQEYGFTRLRLLVDTIELSLGVVFVLLLVSGVRLSGRWLPRAVAGVGVLAVLGLAVVNPDAWIARHNVDRYAASGQLDVAYLAGLSSDAVPELLELPGAVRSCALEALATQLAQSDDPWWDANLSRTGARDVLGDLTLPPCRHLVAAVR